MIAQSIELLEFGIKFEPRGQMRAQCLTDFVVELTTTTKAKSLQWKLYIDGASNEKGSGAGVILESPVEVILKKSMQFKF